MARAKLTKSRKAYTSSPRAKPRQLGHLESSSALGSEDNQSIASLERSLSVLNAFKVEDPGLGNAELAERTEIPKATVSRITYTLAKCGYLAYDPRRRVYELGGQSVILGRVAMSRMNIHRLARPLMQAFATSSDLHVGLGTRDRLSMLVTDTCEGNAMVGLRIRAGQHLPIINSALGRAYLAALSDDQRGELLTELEPQYGDAWPRLLDAVGQAVAQIGEQGFCTSLGEWHKEVHGAGAPIFLPDGGAIYAVNVGGPSYSLTKRHLIDEIGPQLARLAQDITHLVGSQRLAPRKSDTDQP